MIKVNFGCFNSNIHGWIGVDHALRHIIIQRIPLLSYLLWKVRILNDEQYKWHKQGCFKSVRYGDARRQLKFKDNSVDYIYSSHMLEHLFKEEAVFFLKECFRILKKGGSMRICIPDWDSLRPQSSFENSGFAKNQKDMKISHKWLWTNAELQDVLGDIGFQKIIECKYREGYFPDLEQIEHRKGLIIQAQK